MGKSLVIENDIIASELKPGGILVKTSAYGVCHTDVEVLNGAGVPQQDQLVKNKN